MRISLNDQRVWYTVLGLSVTLRVAMAPFTGHPYDIGIWMMTGGDVAAGLSPYLVHPHIGYPPLWALWCGVAYLVSNFISRGNPFVYIFVIKIPILVADFVLALMLLAVSKKLPYSGQATGRILAACFLLNPYVLIVGVIWGMMDNLVAVLLIASIILLVSKPAWSGVSASLAVALKLYPILFLPVMFVYLASTRKFTHIAEWVMAFLVTSLVTIWLPFVIFRWDVAGFIGVGLSQVSRNPGGIAPLATIPYLANLGITSVGPVSIQDIINAASLRLIWIPALIMCVLFIIWKRPRLVSIPTIIHGCSLLYLTYLLTASWISEQLFELVLILMLFVAAFCGLRRFSYRTYTVGSAIVLLFLTFNVPLTSFVFPLYLIDRTPLAGFGKSFLPWLALTFGCYLIAEIVITAEILTQPD